MDFGTATRLEFIIGNVQEAGYSSNMAHGFAVNLNPNISWNQWPVFWAPKPDLQCFRGHFSKEASQPKPFLLQSLAVWKNSSLSRMPRIALKLNA